MLLRCKSFAVDSIAVLCLNRSVTQSERDSNSVERPCGLVPALRHKQELLDGICIYEWHRLPKRPGIYRIVHIPTGREYIGSAVNLRVRLNDHFRYLRRRTHISRFLQSCFAKHGMKEFHIGILELVSDKMQLIAREQFHIDARKPVFNICPVAGSALGRRHTEETKRKIALANLGQKRSEETRARMRAGCLRRPPVTNEFRAKMSRLVRSRGLSYRLNMSRVMKGRIHTPTARHKLSLALMGHSVSEEAREKMSDGHKGKPWSAEARLAHEVANLLNKQKKG